jgi:hypothetical protein
MDGITGPLAPGWSDLRRFREVGHRTIPLRTELSLTPLLKFWTEVGDEGPAMQAVSAVIQRELAQHPDLAGIIEDSADIGHHAELLDLLMAAVFPPALCDREYGAALAPFQLRSFWATPPAERLLLDEHGYVKGRINVDESALGYARTLSAYRLILRRQYGVEFDSEFPIIVEVPDPDTGLQRYFKVSFDHRFVDVVTVGDPPALTEETTRRLRANIFDRELLVQALPPERFILRGFTIFHGVDVTDQEVLSSIKRDLIDRESIVSTSRFDELQGKLRTLLRRPEIRFGLAAISGDRVFVINSGARLEHACIFADSAHRKVEDFAGSLFERAVVEQRPIFVPDLAARPDRTPIEDELVRMGVRTFVVSPLHYQDQVIGTIDVCSPRPGDIDGTHMPLLQEVLPLFSMAVQRSMEELDNRIQAFIKAKATAIHPSVDWRFRQAVLSTIERRREGESDGQVEMEPIVFPDVYPLYALSDIRGSSSLRASAIQADLLAQLGLAHEVIEAARQARPLPALGELLYRVDKQRATIAAGITAGDELGVIAFLRKEVEPLFAHLETFGAPARARVDAYRAALDPRIGVVYIERRRFEESVARLSDAISAYIDLEEQAAQEMYPHYFEKQQTDGVDYQIYVGASLKEDGVFDPIYLKNLRIWQLMVTCGAARRAHQLRDQLPLPLDTTHLVLVQHMPLSIRFRFDEKRFDVDGAYDIRYAIVKKRIDKALIRGTTERLTQPGMIAIVYSQPSEAQEYRRYIEYLQSLGYLTPGIEDVELEELQGVHGLRALRVAVDLTHPQSDRPVALADLARRAS